MEFPVVSAVRECSAGSSSKRILSSDRSHMLELASAILLLTLVGVSAWARTDKIVHTSPLDSPVETETIRLPVVDGKDIRFARVSSSQGLSQVRVSDIVQDDQGFIWFGTWNGLNRYDGYNFKVFKHDSERPESLSGVFIFSLFKDRAGTIWVGTDQSLDRFDPRTEKFTHYHFDGPDSDGLTTTVEQISQDSSGMLWLSTRRGLFRLDPDTGKSKRFYHDPRDPYSLGDNTIKSAGEDRAGRFWVGTSQTLDEFDRNTGKVKRHVLTGESGIGLWFHEDRFGVFWIIYGSDGHIATFDRKTNKLTRYGFDIQGPEGNVRNPAYALMEDHEGTMWFGTAIQGLLKFDRERRRFISYHNHAGDSDSLADNRVIALFEDHEENIWVGMHDVEPHFFATKPPPFAKFTSPSGSPTSINPGLVGALYQDQQGVLWVGVNRSLVRIDRKTGLSSSFKPVAGYEVLSIIEDGPDVLWIAGTNPLLRYNRKSGELRRYTHDRADPSSLCSGGVQRLLFDHKGTLWAATWDGLCRFDARAQRFTTYNPNPKTRGLNYYAIAEDRQGSFWLGSNLGLHRFDPNTGQFTVYSHKSDDLRSLSDNRVVAVYFDRTGSMWVGTQNGLDKFDLRTNTFSVFNERDGMGGNVVSCILEDQSGLLWMSTNKGVSSFNPKTQKFKNYTMADGLPGPDLTGWGACFKSATGEMSFGGFSGVTAFFPDQVVADAVIADAFVPPIVLTDFRLFGRPVNFGPESPLKEALNYTDTIRLSHSQNVFSIGFSALSFFNPSTNRYRYMLEGLDQKWNEVGSDQRLASYTTLPPGNYTLRVQGASRRGPWSEPGIRLHINILPPWWATWWFRLTCLVLVFVSAWGAHRYHSYQLLLQFNMRLDERLSERTRIARELHDSLLQGFQGLMFRLQAVRDLLPGRPSEAMQALDVALERGDKAIAEGRDTVSDLREPIISDKDIAAALTALGEELTAQSDYGSVPCVRLLVEGKQRELNPVLRDEIYRIGREALRNAFRHARAQKIEAEITYGDSEFQFHMRDDGIGIAPEVADQGARAGHWGLPGMRERARRFGGRLEVWSEQGAGTEIELSVPAAIAYGGWQARGRFWFLRKKIEETNGQQS
jgi:ligand-binding sensor domain-containing protein/signal transduction histidine kinase